MWLQRFTNYLLERPWTALALVFAVSFVPMLGVVGILFAVLVTLRKGVIEGAVMVLAATLPFIFTFAFTEQRDPNMPLMIWAAVGVAVLSNLLTWVFAVLLERKASWSLIIQVAALMGIFFVSVVHLMLPDVAGWWQMELSNYYISVEKAAQPAADAVVKLTQQQAESIAQTKLFATGVMTAGVLFNALVQLVAARWWEALTFRPNQRSLQKELHSMRLSKTAGILFIIALALSYMANPVVLDLMPIVYILFCAAGLSLVHALFKQMQSPTRSFWLLLLYVGIIFTMPVSIVMVSILALADIWLDIRHRFNKAV